MGSIRPGTRVELVEQIFGYDAGEAGLVVHVGPAGQVLVRFDSTGHSIYLEGALVKESSGAS